MNWFIWILINELPESIIPEIYDYIEFLLSKYGSTKKDVSKFRFDWEGSLNKLKNKYSSVDLQHKLLENLQTSFYNKIMNSGKVIYEKAVWSIVKCCKIP